MVYRHPLYHVPSDQNLLHLRPLSSPHHPPPQDHPLHPSHRHLPRPLVHSLGVFLPVHRRPFVSLALLVVVRLLPMMYHHHPLISRRKILGFVQPCQRERLYPHPPHHLLRQPLVPLVHLPHQVL